MTTIANEILLRSLVLFLMLGSVTGVLVAGLMMWRPEWLARINNALNRWISTREMSRPLEQAIKVDHWFYRYSRISGTLLLAGGVYIVFVFTAPHARDNFLSSLNSMHLLHPLLLALLLDELVLLFIAAAILAILLSLFLVFRPSMLKDIELRANKRLSLRETLKPVEMQHAELDLLLFRHYRLAGLLLLCGSLYTLLGLGFWLSR